MATCRVMPGNQSLELPQKPFAGGSEADIYRLNASAVAKLPRVVSDEWADKVSWAVSHRGSFELTGARRVVWPQRLLLDATSGRVVGYLMHHLAGYVPLEPVLHPQLRARLFPEWDAATLVEIVIRMLECLDWLHKQGVIHGDLSPGNWMVNRRGDVALIDCDCSQYSVSNRLFPCRVSTPDYCPPDLQALQESEMARFVRGPSHDVFSMSVMLMQMLGGWGTHPYSGRWDKSDGSRPASTEKRIELNAWAGACVGKHVGKVAFPKKAILGEALGARLCYLRSKSFDGGWLNANNRPRLSEWITGLRRYRWGLKPCVRNARHQYHRRLNACPYCEAIPRAGFEEPFPRSRKKRLKSKANSGWL